MREFRSLFAPDTCKCAGAGLTESKTSPENPGVRRELSLPWFKEWDADAFLSLASLHTYLSTCCVPGTTVGTGGSRDSSCIGLYL